MGVEIAVERMAKSFGSQSIWSDVTLEVGARNSAHRRREAREARSGTITAPPAGRTSARPSGRRVAGSRRRGRAAAPAMTPRPRSARLAPIRSVRLTRKPDTAPSPAPAGAGEVATTVIKPMAVENGATVLSKVYDVSVMNTSGAGENGSTVRVLAVVNQATTTNAKKAPQTDQNRVVATMDTVDGRWLISRLDAF